MNRQKINTNEYADFLLAHFSIPYMAEKERGRQYCRISLVQKIVYRVLEFS